MGVPVKLGAGGIEEIVELDLTDDEQRGARGRRPPPSARSSASLEAPAGSAGWISGSAAGRRSSAAPPPGMGLAIAEALAAEGANVAMFARRRDAARARGRAARRARRPRRRHRPARPRAARRADGRGLRRHRHPRQQRRRPAARRRRSSSTDEAVESAVELLLLSAVRLTEPLPAPPRAQRPRPRSINIESSSVREPIDNLALSNAVRPGVIGWAKTLAREVGPKGITVNSIAPGRIDTERLAERLRRQAARRATCATIPLRPLRRRRGRSRDVVCFLASDRASLRHRHRDPGRRRPHARPALSAHTPSARDCGGSHRARLAAGGLVLSAVRASCSGSSPSAARTSSCPTTRIRSRRSSRSRAKRADRSRGGIYFVDVLERKATLLERLFPGSATARRSSRPRTGHARRERPSSSIGRCRRWPTRSRSPRRSRSSTSATRSSAEPPAA